MLFYQRKSRRLRRGANYKGGYMDWIKAEEWLKEVRERYRSIGISGLPALNIVITPLAERFYAGERTEELFNEIMKLE